jgi:hypothetical protein
MKAFHWLHSPQGRLLLSAREKSVEEAPTVPHPGQFIGDFVGTYARLRGRHWFEGVIGIN